MNSRRIGYVILAALFWAIAGAGCVSPTKPVAASVFNEDQPARLASPTAIVVPAATGTSQAITSTPAPTRMAVDTRQDLIPEPSAIAQPQEDRTPIRVVIPAIELDAPIEPEIMQIETQAGQSVNVWVAPDHFAAGWLTTSAPTGAIGNTVLDGHHNIDGKVFKDLINVQAGDTITLYATGQERAYRVNEKLILAEAGQPLAVRQANARYIAPTLDERLTLVTCWPPTGNSHRLLIIALPVSLSVQPAN